MSFTCEPLWTDTTVTIDTIQADPVDTRVTCTVIKIDFTINTCKDENKGLLDYSRMPMISTCGFWASSQFWTESSNPSPSAISRACQGDHNVQILLLIRLSH